MEIPVIYIFTHDSIGVGEDGPTHQPVEQLASLRAIPGLIVLRPADANEVAEAWRVIMQLRHEPVALVLTRQALPTLDRTQVRAGSGRGQGRLRAGRRRRAASRRDPDRHRQRGALAVEAHDELDGGGHQAPRGQHAVLGAVRPAAAGVPRPGPAAARSRPASRSSRPRRLAGTGTSAPTARSSACTRSARPRR